MFPELPLYGVLRSLELDLARVGEIQARSERPLGTLLAQCKCSLLDGRGVSHQLKQSTAELLIATLSDYLRPLTLGGKAHIAYHLREIPSALREAHDPGASVRRIGGALQVAPLLKIAQ